MGISKREAKLISQLRLAETIANSRKNEIESYRREVPLLRKRVAELEHGLANREQTVHALQSALVVFSLNNKALQLKIEEVSPKDAVWLAS